MLENEKDPREEYTNWKAPDASRDTALQLKQQNLQKIRERIEQTTDLLGSPIEPGIKETVVMFNAMELKTTQSCEGHEDEPGRSDAPFVEVYPDEPEGEDWHENDELRGKIEAEERQLKMRALNLLGEFYQDRKVPYDAMLGFSGIGYGFRIQSQGTDTLPAVPSEIRKQKRAAYKNEMEEFTKFLETKYFSTKG